MRNQVTPSKEDRKERIVEGTELRIGLRRTGDPAIDFARETLLARLRARIGRDPDDWTKCWTWAGGTSDFGYGIMKAPVDLGHGKLKNWVAHRLLYALLIQDIPDGMLVLHRCDNPPCCNPRHLFLGTHKDNTQDMIQKGRSRFYDPTGKPSRNRALSPDQVREIRSRSAAGERQRALAAAFGVSQVAIHFVVSGKTYREVEG